ncbi:MAG: GAF domain-containing protein, partial [Gallionella sp.]
MQNNPTLQDSTRHGLAMLGALRFQRLGLRTRFAVLFYLVCLSSVALVGWYGYQNAGNAYRDKATQLAQGHTAQVAIHIGDFLELTNQDLRFIADNYALQRLMYWTDIGVPEKQEEYYDIVADTLRGFANTYPYNFKIRIVDNAGREVIRIRRDPWTGNTAILPKNQLEDVGDRPYFTQALPLAAGDTVVAALDFNRAGGKIETPLVPVLRQSSPLVSANKARYGVVMTSVRADAFYHFIDEANRNEQGRTLYLVDPAGHYLFHPEAEKMFGHLLGHGANIERDYPGLLAQMQGHDQGSLTTDAHIVTYQAIHPAPGDRKQYWLLVGMVPEAVAMAELSRFEYAFTALAGLVILLVLAATRYFLGNLMTPLQFVTRQLQRLGRGEIEVETLVYPAQDEIRSMVDSSHALMLGMERLAQQADAVGQGDFTGQAALLSEQDRLGNALNNMIRLLRTAKADSDRRNWLKDGLSRLTQTLTGDLSSQALADLSIGMLGRYLDAGRGVFYRYDGERQTLDLLGSYMYTERNHAGSHCKTGDGAIGQVALEKKPIILNTTLQDSPPVVTGTRCVIPPYTHTWPLLRDGELLGVLELAGFEHFDELKQEFLDGACDTIAAFLFVAEQRERIKKLLGIAEASEREAREQSRRLQEANTLMEEQQQQLQQQTEELQQTNAQMEEQQQQLQQQTEELQQTNAQMEEQQRLLEQRNRDLVQSQRELDDKARQLEQSGRYKSEFLANMSHELRTPLNSIILLSKMMAANEDARLDAEAVKRAEIILRSGEDLLRLINDVLDLSKVEAGRMVINASPIASNALLAEFLELFEPAARERGLEFRQEDLLQGEFTSDPDKLAQILRNLLSNAFKFTRQGSVILRLERRDHPRWPIRISVRDTGIGIPADKQQLIFEAFQQVDGSTSREFGGTGLGLTISRRFAQLLGGTIELSSTPGEGSEFALLLPETPLPTAVAAVTSAPLSVVPAVQDDRAVLHAGDQVILLIDDDGAFGQAVIEI